MKYARPLALAALLLLAALAGCTARQEAPAAPTPVPAAEEAAATAAPLPAAPAPETPAPAEEMPAAPAPEPTPAPPVLPGSYRWDSDTYGSWILNLKENGTFSVIGGDRIYNGEGWSTTPDGCAVTGPTEAAGAAPFFDEFGSSLWRVDGDRCEPVW